MPLDKPQNDSAQGWHEVPEMPNRVGTARQRFEANVVRGDGCWAFKSAPHPKGYHRFKDDNGKTVQVHRYAYELLRGPIPDGLTIDHLCRNRGCCNPDHLEPVTSAENTKRGMAGEWLKAKTHCPQGHEYSVENTYRWHRGGRQCRICKRASVVKYRAKQRGMSRG